MKEQILERVRRAIGKTAAGMDVTPVERSYRQTGTLDEAARLELFISRLEDYNAVVYRCSESDVPPTIAQAMAARSKHSLVIPPGFPQEWLPDGIESIRDTGLSYDEIDKIEGALTACTVAISMTGTIVLTHSAHEGRRALTLIPDYHLCLVRAEQVVETVPEGIRKLKNDHARPITTISGPSATADIEMTRIKGVHGPRILDVILIAG